MVQVWVMVEWLWLKFLLMVVMCICSVIWQIYMVIWWIWQVSWCFLWCMLMWLLQMKRNFVVISCIDWQMMCFGCVLCSVESGCWVGCCFGVWGLVCLVCFVFLLRFMKVFYVIGIYLYILEGFVGCLKVIFSNL